MSIIDFIAVVSFGLTCFSVGYTFGKDNHKSQKYPPWSDKLSDYFCFVIHRTNRLSAVLFFCFYTIIQGLKSQSQPFDTIEKPQGCRLGVLHTYKVDVYNITFLCQAPISQLCCEVEGVRKKFLLELFRGAVKRFLFCWKTGFSAVIA